MQKVITVAISLLGISFSIFTPTLTARDEVVGLTRAFLSAGASSVLSSLWSVPSLATEQLMVSFYVHLQSGMSKADALRAAQLYVTNISGYTEPWFWAPYQLIGRWR